MTHHIIVTGATGFIGRHLTPILLEKGYSIGVITRNAAVLKDFEWGDHVTDITHDLNNPEIDFDIPKGASLIHLAWEGLPHYNELFHVERNLPNQFRFIKSVVKKGVGKVLVTGTCFEYGFKEGAISADETPDPQNAYAIAKNSLRQFLTCLQKQAPFTLQWARLFYMYGPGQNPKSILAQLDAAIDNGDDVFNMSGGEQLRDYLPVEKVAYEIFKVFQNGSDGCFNICSGEPISIRELVENRIKERGSDIKMNLGYYPYPDYEPMAFWGKR